MTPRIEKRVLIIEDGDEYESFARVFLADRCHFLAAHGIDEALAILIDERADAFLIDLRFDRSSEETLAGDIEETATRLFAGDRAEALRYLKENQGTLILAVLREAGHHGRAVFVHDFPKGRLDNLRRLYGDVAAVPSFDAGSIAEALGIDEE